MLSIREQAHTARRLATLIGVNVPLPEAFLFVAKSSIKKKRLYAQYIEIIQRITEGRLCSEALDTARIFDRSFINLIRIGEKSGSLEEAITHAALALERRDALSKKIIGIMIYPVIVGVATFAIAGFLVVYIFPKIIPLVTSMNIPLPLLTRILMLISNTVIHQWFWICVGISTLSILSLICWRKISTLREMTRGVLFKVPIVGEMYKNFILIDLFDSLGLLLTHGETLPASLVSIRNMITYSEFKRALTYSIDQVDHGRIFSESLIKHKKLFPQLIVDLIEIAERTGSVASSCTNIARIYERETEDVIQKVSRVIEPVLMLGMGGIVGSIALSIVLPIYEITNHINH